MALKDWEKFKGEDAWEKSSKNKHIILKIIEQKDGYYTVKDVEDGSGFESHPLNLSRKKTKEQAISFAKSYMRSH